MLHSHKTPRQLLYAKRVQSGSHSIVAVLAAPWFRPFLEAAGDPRVLWLRLAAVLLVAAVLCYLLVRSITAPLRQLSEAAGQFAKGNLSVRVGPALARRADELGELARDFDRMASQIERLVDSQRRLLEDVSQELRSPLARLNVALGLARQKAPAELTDSLERIEREANRLNRLIGRLPTMARFDAKADQMRQLVKLDALLETLVQDAAFEAESRGVTVRIVRSQPCTVLGHFDLLYAALEEIVRNAIRYTAPGTAVEITLDRAPGYESDQVRVRVRDHGPGVLATGRQTARDGSDHFLVRVVGHVKNEAGAD